MTQDQIHYQNIELDLHFGPYYQYKSSLHSGGAILHWVYVYTNLSFVDMIKHGDNKVYFANKEIFSVTWTDDNQPIFVKIYTGTDKDIIARIDWLLKEQEFYMSGRGKE